MTGFGNAAQQSEHAYISVELKAVNNRYLKLSMRLPDMLARFESDVERLIRDAIARGSVQLSVRARLNAGASQYSIDVPLMQQYLADLRAAQQSLALDSQPAPALSDLLPLPGVVMETDVAPELVESLWPLLESCLNEALEHFHDFRRSEGESMRQDLKLQVQVIADQVDLVQQQAPVVVEEYRAKLLERIRKAFLETDIQVEQKDVIRDVAIYADRCDINEEITRLRSHLEQFHRFLDSPASTGRKLEFLSQEMSREVNTIGSKANNVSIAHSVVEIKAAMERVREVLQNVE